MAPKPKFAEGEKVLCFHGPLIYEAKCLKRSVVKDIVKYFIHYAGWNKNWDEWVPESRVLKYNDANIKVQKELQQSHSIKPAKNKTRKEPIKGRKSDKSDKEREKDKEFPALTPVEKEPVPIPKKSVSTDAAQSPSSSDSARKKQIVNLEVHIRMPKELKMWLADDWDMITRRRKLTNQPARVSVDTILNNYISVKKSSRTFTLAKESFLSEVIAGTKDYFNTALGCMLLYRSERPQHADILREHPGTPVCEIYGAIHLLRLFTKIGDMLATSSLDEKSAQKIATQLEDLMKYIVKNSATLLSLSDYVHAPHECESLE